MKTVYLDSAMLKDRNSMYMYMHEIFALPENMGRNLDALHDVLSEVRQDTLIICTHDCIKTIRESGYAFKVLLVLGKCSDENSHIKIQFR